MVHGGMLDGGRAKWDGGGEQGNVTGVRDGGLCVCIVSAGWNSQAAVRIYCVYCNAFFDRLTTNVAKCELYISYVRAPRGYFIATGWNSQSEHIELCISVKHVFATCFDRMNHPLHHG